MDYAMNRVKENARSMDRRTRSIHVKAEEKLMNKQADPSPYLKLKVSDESVRQYQSGEKQQYLKSIYEVVWIEWRTQVCPPTTIE
jgi:hypothetical protein